MPFEIRVEEDGTVVFTRYFGTLTTAEIEASYSERFNDEVKVCKYALLISDYTDVTETDLDDVDIRYLAKVYLRAASYNPNVTAVAIMGEGLLFGLGRMWQAYVSDIPWKEAVVRTKEDALEFLKDNTKHSNDLLQNLM